MLKPMKAPHRIPTVIDLKFPMFASKKLDGIRCLVNVNGDKKICSSSGKAIPNLQIRHRFENRNIGNNSILDGELWSPTLPFNEIMSIVMSKNKPIDGTFIGLYLFDCLTKQEWENTVKRSFLRRYNYMKRNCSGDYIHVLNQVEIQNYTQLKALFDQEIAGGGEGIIVRSLQGYYKHGRCTFREHNMFKLKQFEKAEGIIIGYSPLTRMLKGTFRERNILGELKNILRQEDRYEEEALGALLVRIKGGIRVSLGTGLSLAQRYSLWQEKEELLGRWVEFKHMPYGAKDKPRFPRFVRFISEEERQLK